MPHLRSQSHLKLNKVIKITRFVNEVRGRRYKVRGIPQPKVVRKADALAGVRRYEGMRLVEVES